MLPLPVFISAEVSESVGPVIDSVAGQAMGNEGEGGCGDSAGSGGAITAAAAAAREAAVKEKA